MSGDQVCSGLLADAGVRRAVLGRDVAAADGDVLTGLGPDDVARLMHFRAVLGQDAAAPQGCPDDPVLWAAAADEIMALRGQMPADRIRARLQPILVRAGSRVRAGMSAPTALRLAAGAGDVVVAKARTPYAAFFAVEEYDIAWRRFDGTFSDSVTRATFVSGDAVTVLPYDPVRDRVLVVEQFRAGPFARGDGQSWQLEAIAGRIDPGEAPEQAARREAEEEAGLRLDQLIRVAEYYPSPGAMTEYLYSYVALVDLPDGSAGVFGVAGEAEDIRGHLISLDSLLDLVASGEVQNAPLILTAFWLQRERPQFR